MKIASGILGRLRLVLRQRLRLDDERVTPLKLERLLDEILDVFEAWVAGLAYELMLGIRAERARNADQRARGESRDRRW